MFLLNKGYGQTIGSLLYNNSEEIKFDTLLYNKRAIYKNGTLVYLSLTNKFNKTKGEYIRQNEKEFWYQESDSNEIITNKGSLIANLKHFDNSYTVKMPDWIKDKSGSTFKDSIIYNFIYYDKEGEWFITDSAKNKFRGFFINDKKDSIWELMDTFKNKFNIKYRPIKELNIKMELKFQNKT
jgi:hypothetical protein